MRAKNRGKETDMLLENEKTMEDIELEAAGISAATRYLKEKGYEIVESDLDPAMEPRSLAIVARSPEGTLCFVLVETRKVDYSAGSGWIPVCDLPPEEKWQVCAVCHNYLTKADFPTDSGWRIDHIGIGVNASGRAFLRHHKGCIDAFAAAYAVS